MAQVALDLTTGDLAVGEGGFQDATGIIEIAQHTWSRLQIVRGEIVYNIKLGVPYIEEVFAVGTPSARVQSIFRREILDTPGVLSMLEGPDLTFDESTRRVTSSFRADTDDGELVFDQPVNVQPLPEVL